MQQSHSKIKTNGGRVFLVLIKKNSFCQLADFCGFLNILTAMISFRGQVRNEGSMAVWLGR